MKVKLSLALLTVILVGAVVPDAQSAPRHPKPAFSISISTAHEFLKLGDELEIEIATRNTSNQELMFSQDGIKDLNLQVEVRDAAGQEPRLTADYDRRLHPKTREDLPFGGSHADLVKPGRISKEKIILTRMFDLTAPGKYMIQVHRFDEISKTEVKSNSISVIVNP
jgi:hypothetical protein